MISRCIGFFILFACFVASSTAITTSTDSVVTLTRETSLGLETNTLDQSSALETVSITSSSLEGQFSAYITSFHSNHDSSVLENTISSASELSLSLSTLSLSLSQTPPLLNIQPSTSATEHLTSSEEPFLFLSATHLSDGSYNEIFSSDVSQSNVYSANTNFIFTTPFDLQKKNVQTSYTYLDSTPTIYSSLHEGTHDNTYQGDTPIVTTTTAQNSVSSLPLVVESPNSDFESEIAASVPMSAVTPSLPAILSTMVNQDILESQVTPTVTSVYGESSVVALQSNDLVIDHPSISETFTTVESKTFLESYIFGSESVLTTSDKLKVQATSELLETILGKETHQLLYTSFREEVIPTSDVFPVASKSILIDYTSYPIEESSSSLSLGDTSTSELLSAMSTTGSTSRTEAVSVLSDASPSLQTTKDAGSSTEVIEATGVSTESLSMVEPQSTVDAGLLPISLEFTLLPSISTLITFYQETPGIVLDLTSASMSDVDQGTSYTASFTLTDPEVPSLASQMDTDASAYTSDMLVTSESDFIVTDLSNILSSVLGLYSDESYSSLSEFFVPTSTSDYTGIILSDSSLSLNSEYQITLTHSQSVLTLLTPASSDISLPSNSFVSNSGVLGNNSPVSFLGSSDTFANSMVDSSSTLTNGLTEQSFTHVITPSSGSFLTNLSDDPTSMIGTLTAFASGDALTVSDLTTFNNNFDTSLSGLLTPSQSDQITPSLLSDLTPVLGSTAPYYSDYDTTFPGLMTSYPYQSESLTPSQSELLTASQSNTLITSQSEMITSSQSELLTASQSEALIPSQSEALFSSQSETVIPSQSEFFTLSQSELLTLSLQSEILTPSQSDLLTLSLQSELLTPSKRETLTSLQSEKLTHSQSEILIPSKLLTSIQSESLTTSISESLFETLTNSQSETVTPLLSDLIPSSTSLYSALTPLGTITPLYSDLTTLGTITPLYSDLTTLGTITPLYSDLTTLGTITPLYSDVTPSEMSTLKQSVITSFDNGLLTVFSETLTSAVESEAPLPTTMLTLTPSLSEELTLTSALSQSLVQTVLSQAIESSSISSFSNVESIQIQSTSISDVSSIDGTAFSSMTDLSESVLASDVSKLSSNAAMPHTGSLLSSSDITPSFSDSSVIVSDTALSDLITSDSILASDHNGPDASIELTSSLLDIHTGSLVFSLHSSSMDTSLMAVTSLDSSSVTSLDSSSVTSLDASSVTSLDASSVTSLDSSSVTSLDSPTLTVLASDSSLLHSEFDSTSLTHDLIDSLTSVTDPSQTLDYLDTISEPSNFKSISNFASSELATSETNSLTPFLSSFTEVVETETSIFESVTESLQIEASSLETQSVLLTGTEPLSYSTESLTESLPFLTQTLPIMSESDLSETFLFSSETLPFSSETLPFSSETLPFSSETLPFSSETLPFSSETLPFSSETLPFSSESLPFSSETLPLLTETLPFSSETLPLLTETLSYLTETLPVMSESVPSETLSFLTDSRSVMTESESMIMSSLSQITTSLTVTEATLQPSSTSFESTPSSLTPSFMTSSPSLTTVTSSTTVSSSSVMLYSPSASASIDSSSVSTVSSVIPNTTEGLNSSDSYVNYWIRTVIIVGRDINVTTDEFQYEIELKLANAYDEAYQRQNATEQQQTRKKRMAVSESGDIKLQINNVTRDNTSDEVEFIYLLMKNGSYILAPEAVRVFGYLSEQEVALRLGYVVVVKAEPYVLVPIVEEDKKLWIIGAVLGPIALFLLIWLIMCITFRCCRRSKETKPQLVMMKKSDTPPEGAEYSQQLPQQPEDSYIEEPLERSNGPMLYSNAKRGLYEVNPESDQDIVKPAHQSPQKKSPTKKGSNGVGGPEVLSDTGDTVTYISEGDLTTTKPKPKTRTRKSKPRSRETAHIAVPDEGEADRSDSPPDQQTAELLQIERKRNKQRLRERRKVDDHSKSSDVDQNYPDIHRSKKRPSKPRRNKVISQMNGGYSDDENDEKPPESLHEARKRMHQLLDDAFSLLSSSTSSIGSSTSKTSIVRLARNKVGHQDDLESSKPPRHPRGKKPEKSRKEIEDLKEIPELEQDKKPEKQHTPMFINRAYTSDIDDGIESWTPYRAGDVVHKIGDEVLRISLPHSQPIKQTSPRQDKLVTSTFVNDDLESSLRDNFHNNEHAKPIEIQTKDLNDTNHKLNGIAHKSLDIPNGYNYPGLKNYEDIPIIEVTKDGNMLSFVDDNIELEDLVAKTKNIPNGNLQNGHFNEKFNHTPYQAWKGEDEMDILKKAIKPGEAPTPLIESIRDELNHLSKTRSENKQLNISATSDIHV